MKQSDKIIIIVSALTLLVGWQEGHLACKKLTGGVLAWLSGGAGMVVCLERDADLHMAQLMPLPLTVSCFSKIQIRFTFLVPADLVSPGQRAVKRVCVCVCSVTSDDILAKYRKPVGHKSADGATVGPPAAVDGVAKTNKDKGDDEVPLYDSSNLEVCQAFLDAKKKLRLILSSVDLQVSLSNATYNSSAPVAFY